MRKIITEFIVLIGIGGLVWAAISLLINLPSHPVILNPEKEKMLGDKYTEVILTFNGFEKIDEPEIDSVFKVVWKDCHLWQVMKRMSLLLLQLRMKW